MCCYLRSRSIMSWLSSLFLVSVLFSSHTEATALSMQSSRRLPQVDFVHRVVMDQMGSFVMLWTPYDDQIIIEIQVKTLGYVGLGFSASGGMKDADIVIGWIDDQGIVHFSDRHASGNRTPVEDDSQDYKLLGGLSNDTHTVIRFSRPWITCDSTYDFPLSGDTVRVIWAYDALKPDPTKTTLRFHDHRGTKSLYLREPKIDEAPQASQIRTWDIRSPAVELPGNLNTLYWCKLYKIPDLPWKHQVIGYIPLIEEASLPHVHHMILFECTIQDSDIHLDKWVQEKGAQCYSKNMPPSWTACGTPIIAWAIGSQGEMLPEHVGFPLGEKHGGATYFLLEIHYDNPKYKKGFVDSSGLQMMLTDKIRKYDAGILTLGHKVEPSMIIPPGRDWLTKAHCTADCTDKTIPTEGINAFAGILHAHLLGEAITLQQIRNGVELDPILTDKSYDFNYQQARYLKEERVIKPGDHLITTCRYNATHKYKPTFGGFGTDDEMCLVFLAYYPRINLAECYSRPDLALLFDVFGIQNLYDNDRIMNIFSQDHFDSFRIDSEKEKANWKEMTKLSTPGSNADSYRLVDFFRIINISEPRSLKDKSFYSILTDDQTWKDDNLVQRLKKAVNDFQYEPSCLYSGREMVFGLPKKAKTPHYISNRSQKSLTSQCTQSSIQDLVGQTLQSVEDTSSSVDDTFTGNRKPSLNTKKRSEQQSALHRNRAETFRFPSIVISASLFIVLHFTIL